MKRFLIYVLAVCLLAGLLPPQQALAADVQITPTSSRNRQNYGSYETLRAKSFLYPNSIGGLTRVEALGSEYVNGNFIGKALVEDYDSQFRCQASRTITLELPFWGGFFAGENYNFFIVHDTNPNESTDKEVIRVVKYSKDWQRLGSASLYGANTTGLDCALRCAEYGGCLYVHTAHGMFRSSDGLRHQSNMSFCVRESDMTVTSGFYRPISMNNGYAAHSFNQFILVDQEHNVVTLDHADGYPRAVTLFRYNGKAGQDNIIGGGGTRKNLLEFPGDIGDNYTGAEVGGFAETASGYVAAYNYDGHDAWADNDIYLAFVDKNLSDVKTVQLSSGYDTSTPQLAPTGLDGGYILWTEKSRASFECDTNLRYVRYDANGNVGQVQYATAGLSDCAPIYWNGKAVWYSTYGTIPTFYTLDGSGLKSYTATVGTGAPANTAYANTQIVLLDGKSVELQTYALMDSSGGLTNYIRLRDMAWHINGTKAQFSVDWSAGQGTTITTGRAYTSNHSELSTPYRGNRTYKVGTGATTINGKAVNLDSIVLTDDNGGDYTYFKLRDMGSALGFNVSYIDGQVVINTNESYSDAQ